MVLEPTWRTSFVRLRTIFGLLRQTTEPRRTEIPPQWYWNRHGEPPSFATAPSLVFFAKPRSRDALKSRRNGIGTDMANLLRSPPLHLWSSSPNHGAETH